MRKHIYSIIAIFLLTACDSDLDKVHYNPDEAQAAVLQPIENSYVLDAQQSDQTAIEFHWTLPQLNYPASVTTDLQMDIQGNQFGQATILASTKTDSTYSIHTADLNAALLKLQTTNGMDSGPVPVEFRLVSSISVAAHSLYSNVVSSIITPYIEVE